MREQLIALYELQKIDVMITRVSGLLAKLDGASEVKKRLAAAKAALEQMESSLKNQETELVGLESKLSAIDDKRTKFEKRLYGGAISNPKEISAAEKEIETLKEQQGKLDTQILGMYETVDQLRDEVEQRRREMATLEAEVSSLLEKETGEKQHLDSELAELSGKRETAAAAVTDSALMARYDMVRRKTGNTGAARIVDGRCEACRVAVTPFVYRKLAEDKDLFNCESCGRILLLVPKDE